MSLLSRFQRHQALGYLFAVVVTGVAALATKAIQPLVHPSVTPLFILAVAVAALYGGRGPGALASLLGAAALRYWFYTPFDSHSATDVGRMFVFLLVATAATFLVGSVYNQRWRAVQQAGEQERLRQLAEEAALESEMAAQEAAQALAGQAEAEAALRQSQAELADFFETASTGLHWVDEQGTILRANQAELDMLGYQAEEYVGRNVAEFHVDQPLIADILERLRRGETIRHCHVRLRCKSGEVIDGLTDSSGYFRHGRFVHSRCFTRDVTLEREAQDAMARLAAIVSSSSDAIVGKTLDGVITSWNVAAERIFGYSASEMVGQSVFKLIPPELHGLERELLERLRGGEAVELSESERIHKDGRRLWISLSVSPLRDASGAVAGAASIKRDITERKAVEERLRDTQRLQAVGQLAGGIAHEANNQMSVVLGGAHFLLRRTDLPEAARHDVEQIRQAADRVAAITRQLLAFSRRQVLELEDVDLNAVVQTIGPVLDRSLAENQRLVVRLGLLGGSVRADPRQLEQVLLNLTLNARDAMPEGGQLTIETRELEVTAQSGEKQPSPGTYEVLSVQDSGHGMDQVTFERAFEPFFTTKELGKGTGLGLSVVHGIVSQIGGYITVETAPGAGTTFQLYFPVAPSRGEVAPPSPDPGPPPGETTALVVEDDAWVRAMARRALVEAGYEVIEAENGRVALELIRRREERLDVVVTDVGMPELDGYELARCLREERPGLPVVFISGYGDRDLRQRAPGHQTQPFLQKPFSPDALIRMVGQALAAERR